MKKYNFKKEFETPFFSIESSTVNHEVDFPYYRINCEDSVITCLLTRDDDLIFVEQLRPNLNYKTVEMPAGGIEANELPIQAVAREVKEELGLTGNYKYLGQYRLLMNRTTNVDHLFIGLVDEGYQISCEAGIESIIIPRKIFKKFVLGNQYEQLAGLGILQLVDLHFGLNFLNDDSVIEKIWGEDED